MRRVAGVDTESGIVTTTTTTTTDTVVARGVALATPPHPCPPALRCAVAVAGAVINTASNVVNNHLANVDSVGVRVAGAVASTSGIHVDVNRSRVIAPLVTATTAALPPRQPSRSLLARRGGVRRGHTSLHRLVRTHALVARGSRSPSLRHHCGRCLCLPRSLLLFLLAVLILILGRWRGRACGGVGRCVARRVGLRRGLALASTPQHHEHADDDADSTRGHDADARPLRGLQQRRAGMDHVG
jgi:hypothetical protein